MKIKIINTLLFLLPVSCFAANIKDLESMKKQLGEARISVQNAVSQLKDNQTKLTNQIIGGVSNAQNSIKSQEDSLVESINKVASMPGFVFDIALIQDIKPTLEGI